MWFTKLFKFTKFSVFRWCAIFIHSFGCIRLKDWQWWKFKFASFWLGPVLAMMKHAHLWPTVMADTEIYLCWWNTGTGWQIRPTTPLDGILGQVDRSGPALLTNLRYEIILNVEIFRTLRRSPYIVITYT